MTKGDGFALAAAFVGGAIAGAAIGLLFAPEKGEDQRAKIKEALEKRGIKLDKEAFDNLVDEIKNIGRKRECVPAEDFDSDRVERYLRLEATERLTVVTSYVVLIAVVLALATSAIFFLSTGTVKALTLLTENEMLSYYIVGGILVLLIVLVFLLKKPLIENPFVKMYSDQLLNTPTVTEQMMGGGRKDENIRKLAESLVRELDDYNEEGGEE